MVKFSRLSNPSINTSILSSNESDLTSEEFQNCTSENEIAIEAISEKLSEVTALAEELDQALRSAQQDCSILTCSATSASVTSSEPETVVSVKRIMDTSASPEVFRFKSQRCV